MGRLKGMTKGKLSVAIGLIAIAAAAGAAPKRLTPARPTPAPDKAVEALVQSCEAHRFETVIQLTGEDGKPHPSKVKLCGKQGQSDGDWIRTLKDAVKKATESPDMPKTAKDQIVTAINTEIDRLNALDAARVAETGVVEAPIRPSPDAPLARDYSSLPPLPAPGAIAAPTIVLPPSDQAGGSKTGKVGRAASPLSLAAMGVSNMSLRCASPGDPDRADACDIIEPSTLLVIRADAALPAGTELRFVRRGALHGELAVPALLRGQSATLRVPADVCAGVARSRVAIEANGGTIGEYELRC